MVRTRIAPSPTGYPHIGTIYQALFDYAFAKKNRGSFIVRIEDTDRERFVEDAEEKIFGSLDWFGLIEDESPRKGGPAASYRQSERLDIYKKYALELINKNAAYYCFCTKERLDEMRKKLQEEKKQLMYDKTCRKLQQAEIDENLNKKLPYVIRLKVPDNRKILITDGSRGEIEFESATVDDQVLLKADGYPTYHLAVVIDDHLMEITHIVRGEEWITSTPKHVLLYEYFGWDMPLLFHTPLLRNPDKSKLSKRHGHTNVSWYQEEGFLPEAILNFLALMGWSHPEGKEIFSLSEFINLFELKDLKAVAPIFDLEKLKWMNQQYIMSKSDAELTELLKEYYKEDKEMSDILNSESVTSGILIGLLKTRIKTLRDVKELLSESTREPRNEIEKNVGNSLKEKLAKVEDWNKDTIFEICKTIMAENNIKMPVLYYLFTGKERGLPLPESIAMWGKEEAIRRLRV